MTTQQGPRPIPNPGPIISPNHRYPKHRRESSSRLKDYWTLASEILEEPLTYSEASSHIGWNRAIQQEIDFISKNATWTIVDRPTYKNPITAKWILN
jgi:hypothetical protein